MGNVHSHDEVKLCLSFPRTWGRSRAGLQQELLQMGRRGPAPAPCCAASAVAAAHILKGKLSFLHRATPHRLMERTYWVHLSLATLASSAPSQQEVAAWLS